MKFHLITIISLQLLQSEAAVEHFDMSNAHAHSSFTPTQTVLPNSNHNGPVSRSGQAIVQSQTAQNRGSYGTDMSQGYNQGSSQTNQVQATGVTVAQVNTGSMGSASSISSYGVPATGGGYGSSGIGTGQGGSPQGSMTYYYYHYPPPGSQGYGGGWGEPTGGDDGDDFKGLHGLAGLLGLKGLKGLALLKLLKPLLLLSLLFLPLLFLPLLFLLLFIPIPVITMPAQNGRAGSFSGEGVLGGLQIVHQVLNGSQCVEKLACELSQKTKGNFVDSFINSVYDKTETFMPQIWTRGLKTFIDSSTLPEGETACANFICNEFANWQQKFDKLTQTLGNFNKEKEKDDKEIKLE